MEESEIDPEIAAAMGFSSFGTQPNAKRRKVADDAVVDMATYMYGQGKGANSIPLGNRRETSKSTVDEAQPLNEENTTEAETEHLESNISTGTEAIQTQSNNSHMNTAVGQKSENGGGQVPPASEISALSDQSVQQVTHTALLEKTLEELGPQELYQLRKGIRTQDGSIVYFQKSFIEDPWNHSEIDIKE
jgi:hypothetical protein